VVNGEFLSGAKGISTEFRVSIMRNVPRIIHRPDGERVSRRDAIRRGAGLTLMAAATAAGKRRNAPLLPDRLICDAYEKAAEQNIMAAVNPRIFPGYFSVCADGRGFGYGNTYPSLDGHQLTDALLW